MGFSATPLPKVVYDVGPGGSYVTGASAVNALTKSSLDNQKQQIENQYSPYTLSADARLKNAQAQFLPFQYLTNPMLLMGLKDSPDSMKMIGDMASNFLKNNPSGGSMPQPFLPPTGNDGLLGMISNLFNNKNNSPLSPGPGPGPSNQDPNQSGSMPQRSISSENITSPKMSSGGITDSSSHPYSTLVPSTEGGISGAVGQVTAGLNKRPFSGTDVVSNPKSPGGVISVPASEVTSANQTAMQGIQNLTPILQRLSASADKWSKPGVEGRLMAAETLSNLQKKFGDLGGVVPALMKKTGLTTRDISDYASWQADQDKAIETYMKSRNWGNNIPSLDTVSSIIKPHYGEGKEYGNRVQQELDQLTQQVLPTYQRNTAGGFEIPASAANQQNTNQNSQPANLNDGAVRLAKGMKLPPFKSKKQFQDWYYSQPDITKQAVKIHLGGK